MGLPLAVRWLPKDIRPDAEAVKGGGLLGVQQDTYHAGVDTGVCMGAGTVA